jgi:hypothetical protein
MTHTRRLPHLVGALCLGALAACVIPDKFIDFVTPNPNSHAVRFRESVALPIEDRCECTNAILSANGLDESSRFWCDETDPDDDQYGQRCATIVPSALPRFMDPARDEYDFCGCPVGERDTKALLRIDDLYVDDLDVDEDGNYDQIFAALLLDMPNDEFADPALRVAYRGLLDPRQALKETPGQVASLLPNFELLEQPSPVLRRIFIADPDAGTVDLCNDAGVGPGRLDPGWHTLTLIVTDRPWLSVAIEGEEGEELTMAMRDGVPDIAGNATWATREYAFHCSNAEDNPNCECETPE